MKLYRTLLIVVLALLTLSTIVAAQMPPVTQFTNSIGVDTHINYGDYPATATVISLLQDIGIGYVRDGAPPVNATSEYAKIQQLTAAGINFLADTDLRTSGLNPMTPAIMQQILLQAQTARPPPQNVAIESPNELDVSGIPEWITKLQLYLPELYSSVKSINPAIPVTGPSMARPGNYTRLGDIEQYLDIGNIHAYYGADYPGKLVTAWPETTSAPHIQSLVSFARTAVPSKPLAVTETGYNNALHTLATGGFEPVDEVTAAKYLLRTLLLNFQAAITRTYIYELLDEATDPLLVNPGQNYGIVRHDGTYKPAAVAIKNLLGYIKDSGSASMSVGMGLRPNDSACRHQQFSRSNGNVLVVLWQEVPSWQPRQEIAVKSISIGVKLNLGELLIRPHTAQLFDPITGTITPLTFGSTITVQVPDYPVLLEVR